MIAAFAGDSIDEARSHGWDTLKNGELLAAAEAAGFDVLLTTDRNIRHQQNLTGRKIAVVVLSTNRWKLVKMRLPEIVAVVVRAEPGTVTEVAIPVA